MTRKPGTLLIAGGGLGGLSTAIALGRAGHRVRLLEQAKKIEPIGYGIQCGPNVFPIFRNLGIDRAVLEHAHLPSAILMLDARTGEDLARIPLREEFRERFSNPYVCIHRGDLHRALLDVCAGIPTVELIEGAAITGFRQDENHVVVQTREGAEYEADFLIGADGINSPTRRALHPDDASFPAGYVAHRTIVPFPDVPEIVRLDEVVMWAGRGFHVIYYPLRADIGLNVVGVFSLADGDLELSLEDRRRQILERCRNAAPELQAVLELMQFEQRSVIADRAPIAGWHSGRVALLGDAAHPTLQSLAQGACMALEDAAVLSGCLANSGDDHELAFRNYRDDRYARTRRVQQESRELWKIYHAEGANGPSLQRTFSNRTPAEMYDCLEWLWMPIEAAG